MAQRKDLSIPTDIHLPGVGITADISVFERLHQAMEDCPPNPGRRCRLTDQAAGMPLQQQVPVQRKDNAQ